MLSPYQVKHNSDVAHKLNGYLGSDVEDLLPTKKVIHEERARLLQVYEMRLETTIICNQGQDLL